MNSFIRIKLMALQSLHRVCLVFYFLHRKIIILFSKYTIALASRRAVHHNGGLDLLFLILKLCSLQKLIYLFLCSFNKYIHTILKCFKSRKQRQLWFKRNIFFPKIYWKAHTFCAKFFIIIENKCWRRGCFKTNIICTFVKIMKHSNY